MTNATAGKSTGQPQVKGAHKAMGTYTRIKLVDCLYANAVSQNAPEASAALVQPCFMAHTL